VKKISLLLYDRLLQCLTHMHTGPRLRHGRERDAFLKLAMSSKYAVSKSKIKVG